MTELDGGDDGLVKAINNLPREWRLPASAREIGFMDYEIVRLQPTCRLVEHCGSITR